MGVLNVRIDDDLDKEFRLEVVRRFGGRKGAIRMGVEEAIKQWLKGSKTVLKNSNI